MVKVDLILEMEIGITGGVEDGVDNTGIANDKLYSTPEEVWQVYETLSPIAEYLKRMVKVDLILEMEIGITGGVEDGVDNTGVAKDKLYSTPEEVWQVHQALAPISE